MRDVRLAPPAVIELIGKGRKSRCVPLLPNTVVILRSYMEASAVYLQLDRYARSSKGYAIQQTEDELELHDIFCSVQSRSICNNYIRVIKSSRKKLSASYSIFCIAVSESFILSVYNFPLICSFIFLDNTDCDIVYNLSNP